MTTTLDPVEILSRDLKRAAATLTPDEARYLVDYYYMQQENRKRSNSQVRTLAEGAEPSEIIRWLAANDTTFEHQIARALDGYSDGHEVGVWAKSITGIGPIISAGLLANIDIEKAPTVGHIWRFAGLDPTSQWLGKEKARELVSAVFGSRRGLPLEEAIQQVFEHTGRSHYNSFRRLCTTSKGAITRESLIGAVAKRPWSARLKTLCWKIGESFVKVQNHDEDVYGHLMLEYKAEITVKNEQGLYADAAKAKLAKFKIGKDTEAYGHYSAGHLPPAHIHARAKRWAVKLFLAHWQTVAYEVHYGKAPPLPYVFSRLGHQGYIGPPNWPRHE